MRSIFVRLLAIFVLIGIVPKVEAKGVLTEKKLTSEEFVQLAEQLKNSKNERFKAPEGFDEEEGRRARERLVLEQKRIQETEARAAEALAKWNSLTDEEREKVLKEAAERAQKKAEAITRDVELSEKLLQKEAADLEEKLDEQYRQDEAEDKRQLTLEAEKERQEYLAQRDAHRSRKFKERNTSRSLIFWGCMFLLSFAMSSIALRI